LKILWLVNIILPPIAQNLSISFSNSGGWLTGLSNDLLKCENIELAVCFPMSNEIKLIKGKVDNLIYYGFPQKAISNINYDITTEKYLKEIISDFKPDIVHIFGTEFSHSLAMTKAFNNPEKTIINIQGLVSICSKHYYANLPNNVVDRFTFRDFIKQDNIAQQAKKFYKKGKYEIEAIKNANHIVGRTDWDRACTMQINPNAKYHFCNETLRDEFYKHTWDINECGKYSIFISQGNYPIKGLHFILEALPEIIKRFPKTHLYVAGGNIIKNDTLMDKVKLSSYGKYILELIKKYKLSDFITFTGSLNEQQMCERFLKSNVFVSASSIENSPNSVGEAMILGVPTISSDVGGVKNMLYHNVDGFLYQHDAPYMLAYYVCKIFESDELANLLSENAIKHARMTHNRQNNLENMLRIYEEVANNDK
jgi:glycosyltransferase involved in cell wall biosynthesis